MEPAVVAETWSVSGLRDLFVAFCIQDQFYEHSRSLEILGFEKILKARHLHDAGDDYRGLSPQDSRDKVNSLAKAWGHNLKRMLEAWAPFAFEDKVNVLLNAKYSGYGGHELVGVMHDGYFEMRYPVPRRSSDRFPTDNPDLNWDPGNSSAITELVRSLTRICLIEFKQLGIARPIWNRFREAIEKQDNELTRFENLLLRGRPDDYL